MSLQPFREAVWEAVPEGVVPERAALRRDFLLARVGAGQRVLDLGCGDGWFAAELAAAGAHPIAVDASEEALRRARARVEGLDARPWPDGAPLPLDDGAADVAWAGEVLEHVVDLPPWLSEVRRALRPGGELLVTTPDHPLRLRLGLALSARRFAAHLEPRGDHLRFFVAASLRELLEDLGFAVVELRGRRGTLLARARRA